MDSLVSVGTESVVTNGMGDPIVSFPPTWKKAMRAKSLSSVNEETSSLASYRKTSYETSTRQQLDSIPTLDLNPLMEQVGYFVFIFIAYEK